MAYSGDNVIAILARVNDEIQWLLAKDDLELDSSNDEDGGLSKNANDSNSLLNSRCLSFPNSGEDKGSLVFFQTKKREEGERNQFSDWCWKEYSFFLFIIF